jgi:hypothetical protein
MCEEGQNWLPSFKRQNTVVHAARSTATDLVAAPVLVLDGAPTARGGTTRLGAARGAAALPAALLTYQSVVQVWAHAW